MKRILNIGCGYDEYGTDFIDLYPKREEVISFNVDSRNKFPFPNKTFDEVRMYFLFEHLRNHEHILKEIYRILKPGGVLDLKTDNASYWYFALDDKVHTGQYEARSTFVYGSPAVPLKFI